MTKQVAYHRKRPRLCTVQTSSSHHRKCWRTSVSALACFLMLLLSLPLAVHADHSDHGRVEKIKHIIVIYQENWSFDSLYGLFPGANGLANSASKIPQVDKDDNPITVLPQPLNGGLIDSRFPPANGQPALPVRPFDLTKFVQPDQTTGDLIHRFYHGNFRSMVEN